MRNAIRIGGVFALALVTLVNGTSLLDAAVTLPVTTNLELWLDASDTDNLNGGAITDGAQVSAWNDKGTDNDAAQGTTVRQPVWVQSVAGLGNKSAVRFDGSYTSGQGDRLGITGMGLGNQVTAFVVAINSEQTTNTGSCCRPLLAENTSDFSAGGIGFGFSNDSTGYTTDFHIYRNNAGTFVDLPSTPGPAPDADNLFHVYEVVYTTGSISLSEDGGFVTSVGNTLTPTGSGYTVGANIYNNARHYKGDIAEMIIYNSNLTAAQINEVGVYLQNKYGLSGSYSNDVILTATGDWEVGGNWTGGVAPNSGADAYVGGGFTATVNLTGQAAGSLTIGHNKTTSPGNGTVVVDGGDLDVVGNLTLGQTGRTGTLSIIGSSVTVGQGVVDGGGTSTLNVDGGTMNVTGGDLKVDTLRVGYLPSGVSAHRSGTVTVTGGGDVEIGSAASRTDLYLGYNTAGNDYNAVGILDLTGAAQFDAYLGRLSLGEVTVTGSHDGSGQGILKLPALSNIDAQEIMVSWSAMHGQTQPTSTIELGTTNNFNVDTFTVAGFRGFALVKFASSGTLTLAGSSGLEADLLIANCDDNTNYAVNGHMDMSGGTFNATLDRLLIGYDNYGPGAGGSVGKLTFNDGTITANSLTLGDAYAYPGQPGLGNGTLDMGGGSLTVNGNASLGTGTSVSIGTINQTGGTLNVTGNVTGGVGSSTLNIDNGTMTIASGFSVDNLRVGYYTGTGDTTASLTVSGGAVSIGTGSGNLDIGRREVQTPSATQGTVDLTGTSSVTINVADVRLGTISTFATSPSFEGDAGGILKLSTTGNNTITANNVYVGDSPSYGNMSLTSLLELGGSSNTINTNLFRIGGHKSEGTVTIAAGGTLTLNGKAGPGNTANLEIGENYLGTGTVSKGTVDLSGGTFNAELDHLYIGRHNTSSGNAEGTLIMDAGTVTANSVQMAIDNNTSDPQNTTGTLTMRGGSLSVTGSVVDGGGTSTINVDGGTMTVAGDLDVDTLRVGYSPSGVSADRSATVTVTGGGNVEIGSAASPTNLYLGYNTAGNNYDATGTLDLTGAARFDAYLQKLSLGEVTFSGSQTGTGQGILKLPALSNIDAQEIMVSWSAMHGQTQPTSTIELGTTNNFNVDTFTVAGFRGFALVKFASSGTLTLAGSSGLEANLLIANCDSDTNYAVNGHMDMSGGTFNATLDRLVIGYDVWGPGGGGSVGKLTFNAGTVTANSLTLGDAGSGLGDGTLEMSGGSLTVNGNASLGTGTAVDIGTVNLSGGVFKADSITKGVGTADFNFTGGTLSVDTFGFQLDQLGGTLAPGASVGQTDILADYNQAAAGILQIEIDGTGAAGSDYDLVTVVGTATLLGGLEVLIDPGYDAQVGDFFDVLTATASIDAAGLTLSAQGTWAMAVLANPVGGQLLRLTAIPEPSTLILFLLGAAGLFTCTRRRQR